MALAARSPISARVALWASMFGIYIGLRICCFLLFCFVLFCTPQQLLFECVCFLFAWLGLPSCGWQFQHSWLGRLRWLANPHSLLGRLGWLANPGLGGRQPNTPGLVGSEGWQTQHSWLGLAWLGLAWLGLAWLATPHSLLAPVWMACLLACLPRFGWLASPHSLLAPQFGWLANPHSLLAPVWMAGKPTLLACPARVAGWLAGWVCRGRFAPFCQNKTCWLPKSWLPSCFRTL